MSGNNKGGNSTRKNNGISSYTNFTKNQNNLRFETQGVAADHQCLFQPFETYLTCEGLRSLCVFFKGFDNSCLYICMATKA